MVSESNKLVKKLDIMCNSGPETVAIDVRKWFELSTLETICETAMGVSLDCLEKPELEYITYLEKCKQMLFERVVTPTQWLPTFWITPSGKRAKQIVDFMHNFSRDVIIERKRYILDAAENNLDNLDSVLNKMKIVDSSKGESEEDDQNLYIKRRKLAFIDILIYNHLKNPSFTIDDIREEVDTFMFEGHDTTSASLCWSTILLAENQDIQEKVYNELHDILGEKQPGVIDDRPLTDDDLRSMKYLEAFIKESLRLYPSVPLITRRFDEPVEVGGFKMACIGSVMLTIFYLHRMESYFEKPLEFNPERFLDPSNEVKPFSYISLQLVVVTVLDKSTQ